MSGEEIRTISGLVKIPLSPEEVDTFSRTIPQTLEAIEVLSELDLSEVEPTSQVTGLNNVFKDDAVENTLPQEQALANASGKERGLFVTKAVFDRS